MTLAQDAQYLVPSRRSRRPGRKRQGLWVVDGAAHLPRIPDDQGLLNPDLRRKGKHQIAKSHGNPIADVRASSAGDGPSVSNADNSNVARSGGFPGAETSITKGVA
jgi:hypothetical protein